MVVWSSTLRSIVQPGLAGIATRPGIFQAVLKNGAVQVRQMSDHGHRTMTVAPSRFQWQKFKDNLHFYTLVGAIPLGLLVFLVNIFVGPAKLTPIPEGYEPKHWEYHKHPISRFMARWCFPTPQQDYEKHLHALYIHNERRQLRFLEERVKKLMQKRRDYQAYYYREVTAKNLRISKEATDYLATIWGDN